MTKKQLAAAAIGSLWTDKQGVTYRVNEQQQLEVYAPNKPENGVNPLNTLSFDINTLIPFNEFNWDTIDGMDAVHNSIMKSYGSLTQQLAKSIDNASANVAQIDTNLTATLERGVNSVADHVGAADTSIINSLDSSLNSLTPQYGTGIGSRLWYIIYHCAANGDCWPWAEQTTSPPAVGEWYGPFPDGFLFCWKSYETAQIIHGHQIAYPGDRASNQAALINLYESAANEWQQLHPTWNRGDGDGSGNTVYDIISHYPCKLDIPSVGPPPSSIPVGPVVPPIVPPIRYPPPPPGCEYILNCPIGKTCTTLDYDENGAPYYIDVAAPGVRVPLKPDIVCKALQPPIDLPPVIIPPVIIPPVVIPPVTTVCPAPIINVPPCPIPVVNVPAHLDQTIDLSKLVNAINELCKCFPKAESASGGSDLQYLYSDAGQERIDTFLDSSGLSNYDQDFSNTFGEGIEFALSEVNERMEQSEQSDS